MTSAPAPPRRYTPEDLLEMENEGRMYELVDGQLLEIEVSEDASRANSFISRRLSEHGEDQRLGRVYGQDLGVRIWPADRSLTRRGDTLFVRRENRPERGQTFLYLPPDLVVEVVSMHDKLNEVRAKVEEWLAGGVNTVWVALPQSREILVYRRGETALVFGAGDEIEGGTAIPGFRRRVAELFPPDDYD